MAATFEAAVLQARRVASNADACTGVGRSFTCTTSFTPISLDTTMSPEQTLHPRRSGTQRQTIHNCIKPAASTREHPWHLTDHAAANPSASSAHTAKPEPSRWVTAFLPAVNGRGSRLMDC
ncbi:hypothetical protein GCM10010112_93700 [Actinoplanes lobatus]|nr:hypothetical protein GCM10010112_93700 [Actinoplanes lobatus]